MVTGTNVSTYFNGVWKNENVPVMRAADHGSWLGTSVFDGARFFEGVAPDLWAHCDRVNKSAKAMMITPTVSTDDMVDIVWEGLKRYPVNSAIYIRPMYWSLDGGYLAIVPKENETGFAICLEEIPMADPLATSTLTQTSFRRPVLEDNVVNAKAGCLYPNNARMLAEAQKKGGTCAFVDAEHALDPVYAKKLGVNTDEMLISQPDNGEQALEIADILVKSGTLDVVVIDSVAALVPKAELEGDMGDSHMGLQARLMSQALRKLTGTVSKSKTCVIFINQLRHKIGVMFGSPETTTGGNALKFYSSLRLDIRRIASIKDGDSIVGNRTRVKVVKNKMASPGRMCEFDIMYGEGISYEGDLLDLAVKAEIIKKMGSWYSYNDDKIGQGRENAKQYLVDNSDFLDKIHSEVKSFLGIE